MGKYIPVQTDKEIMDEVLIEIERRVEGATRDTLRGGGGKGQ